jgi:hypothetical protein
MAVAAKEIVPASNVTFFDTDFDFAIFTEEDGRRLFRPFADHIRDLMDARGMVVLMLPEQMEREALRAMMGGAPLELTSSFRLRYNTLLRLYGMESLQPDVLVRRSFWAFQRAHAVPELHSRRHALLAEAAALTQTNSQRLEVLGRSGKQVLAAVEAARRQGHVYVAQGVMAGTSALAVPIADARGAVVGAISVATLSARLQRDRVRTVLAAMQAASPPCFSAGLTRWTQGSASTLCA